MSFDNDNMIGTMPPGFLAPADGNYAPNATPLVVQDASPAAASEARATNGEADPWADTSVVGAQHAAPLLGMIVDLGPSNERMEDVKPELVNALRELVRQYRQEGIVARRNEIRRIRQARLFWQGLQYAWWNPQDMSWHLPADVGSYDDSAAEEMPRYQFVTNLYQAFGLSFVSVISQDVPATTDRPATRAAERHEPAALLIEPGAGLAGRDRLSESGRQSRLHRRRKICDYKFIAVGAVLLVRRA